MSKAILALLVATSTPTMAWAQSSRPAGDAPAQAAIQPEVGIADIVVTAEKRSTSLQRTPVAVTAITNEALQAAQVRALPDITALVPNFQMGNVGGFTQITVRGIGISNFLPTAESAVAVNLNDVYVSRPIAHQSGLFDISAVEVLRGPQGTLYGRNATAGAVNITTTRPYATLSGFAKINVGNYGLIRAEGAVGGPIAGDQLLVRVAGFREKRNGYGKNIATGSDVDDKDAWAVRATLVFEPSTDFKATVIGEYFKEEDRGSGYHYFGAAGLTGVPGALGIPPFFILLGGKPPSDPYDLDNAVDPRFSLKTAAATAILEWNSGPFGIKSVTGYRDQNSLSMTDISAGNFGGGFFETGEPAHQFSQELQAHYSTDKTSITVGGFYFRESDGYDPGLVTYGHSYANVLFGAPAYATPGYLYLADIGGRIETKALAAFAQGTYHFSDRLSVTAGIRYSRETKHAFQQYSFDATFSRPFTQNAPPPEVSIPAKTFQSTTPKFGIQYQIDRRTLVYLTYTKGFKSGGFDLGTDPSLIAAGFRPEKVTDYEGGIKTTLLDNRLRLNLSGFYYDYSDLQVQQVSGCCTIFTANAATAKIYGAELEASAVITPELTLDANASWLHARYGRYSGADNTAPNLTSIDFSGNRLNNAPDFRAHVSAAYKRSLAKGELTFRAEGDFSSKFYFSPINVDLVGQNAFFKANASLSYKSPSGWQATAYVRNITDRVTRTAGFAEGRLYGTPVVGSYAPPRTFGLELGYEF